MTEHGSDEVFLFGDFRLDRQAGGLFRLDHTGNSNPVALGSRALDLLALLVRRRGEVVSKDDIMTTIWSGRAVEEANLNVQISKLRHILDESRPCGSCIQTVTGYGYRFVTDVTPIGRTAAWHTCPASHGSEDQLANSPGGNFRGIAPPRSRCFDQPDASANHSHSAMADGERPSFLIDRLGVEGTIDRDLAAALRDLRQRLIADYGRGAAATVLIDQLIAAYQEFIRVTGWASRLGVVIERQLFGDPSAHRHDNCCPDGDAISALPVEQHLARLRVNLIPLVERCGAVVREALSALEALRAASCETPSVSDPTQFSAVVNDAPNWTCIPNRNGMRRSPP